MAYSNEIRSRTINPPATIAERVATVLRMIGDAVEKRRVYRQTVRELSELSERDLADLGIHPSMISAIAQEAAYGK